MTRGSVLIRLALLLCALPVGAQAQVKDAAPGRTVEVTAGPHYKAGGLHRFFLGDDYRDLWTMPIRVEVLDLSAYAGGLRPVMRVGGQETKGLAFKGADGRDYTFRGLDKDPGGILPADLQGTIAERLVQDQIASAHPAGPVIVGPLLEAAGVLHVTPRLVVMPDDPALGEFRPVFAGLLGFIEEYPQPAAKDRPGFGGSAEIINGTEMLKRLRESPRTRVDPKAFLRARLMDLFIGDWDRHLKQWRWARVPGQSLWQPIPEDRDQAFSRFEGLVLRMARPRQPRFVDFGSEYPGIVGLTFNGWDQDRRVLTELEKPVWDEIAADLKARLTDAVIDDAARKMPEEYYRQDGARLTQALKARRDALPAEATRFYRHLAREVYMEGTDQAEAAQIRRLEGGDVEVALAPAEGGGEPFFRRRFHPSETHEVRIDLRGGNDRVTVTGGRAGAIVVRVVGGSGEDVFDDSAGGGTRFSDSAGVQLVRGPGTRLDRREYVPPPPNKAAPWIPPRDWGRQTITQALVGGNPDIGVFVGFQLDTKAFGFRQDPYSSRQIFRGGYATSARSGRIEYEGEFRRSNSPLFTSLFARASGIEILRFYGFGNETSNVGPDESFKVKQDQLVLAPSVGVFLTPRLTLSLGPRVKYAKTNLGPGRFITTAQPYGDDKFGEAGVGGALRFDSRDHPAAATRGLLFDTSGSFYPAMWDVKNAFGEVHGDVATYLSATSAPLQPTLALRGGGKRVWGDYPFFEAAFIGGSSTVRGFRPQRFAGDAAVYGNAELRLSLARVSIILPADLGVFGLADAGRVYYGGQTSDKWHTAAGGGIWLAFLNRDATFTIAVARSQERTGLYVRAGFVF
jgi:hypothetical protein